MELINVIIPYNNQFSYSYYIFLWMGGLREKYQNDVLHDNINMAPLNE